ncbi:MAG: BamA/TamA family outer membrane protein [Armatimonadota bacterium]
MFFGFAYTRVISILIAITLLSSCMVVGQDIKQVVSVEVTGNININTDTIKNVISVQPGDDYSEDAVNKDRQAIMDLGYFSVITAHKEDVDGGVKIIYEVTENPRVDKIRILGSDPIPEEEIINLMRTKAGQVLSSLILSRDIDNINNYYQEKGYVAYVTDEINVDPETNTLIVPILVHTVESIEIIGNKKTKKHVFTREMKTKVGTFFNAKTLEQDYLKIWNLDILEDLKPRTPEPGSQPGTLKVVIEVVEKRTGQISLGMGYSSRQKLVGQARLVENNFMGRGQGLNLLVEQGRSSALGGGTSYEVGFFEPWIDDKNTSLSVSYYDKVMYRFSSGVFGSDSTINDDEYNERRKGGDVTVSRPITENIRLFLGGRFENVDTNSDLVRNNQDLASILQKGDVTVGSLKAVRNTRDIDMDPASGSYESLSFEFGNVNAKRFVEVVGSNPISYDEVPYDGSFTKMTFDARRYYSPQGAKKTANDRRNVIAVRLRGGIADGKLPFFEQFFAGGSDTLRGYKEDRFWGKNMLLASAEYRFPIASAMSGVVFVDYGDAWGGDRSFRIRDLEQHDSFEGKLGTGFGVRVTTPIGQLRLDWGVGDEGSRTHFSIGQTF